MTSTGAVTEPTREAITASEPSVSESRVASVGCTRSVQRTLPFTSASTLCIHELFDCKCRRLMSTRPLVSTGSSRVVASRASSSMMICGASSIVPDSVRSASGRRGSSAPKSMPCGLASKTSSERPSGTAPNQSPREPVRIITSRIWSTPVRDGSDWTSARNSSMDRSAIGELVPSIAA